MISLIVFFIYYTKLDQHRSSFCQSQQSEKVLPITSWPISMAHSFADWSLASTITLNMVHKDSGMRKSVERLLLVSFDSNAPLVLLTSKVCEIDESSCIKCHSYLTDVSNLHVYHESF